MAFTRITFLDMPLDIDGDENDICQFLRSKRKKPQLITFVGPGAWALARNDPAYPKALGKMTLVVPDGQGIAFACRFFDKQKFKPIRFDITSLAKPFFETILATKKSLSLVGGGPSVDEDVHAKLHVRYPDLKVLSTTHGFGDFAPKIGTLLEMNPDVVLVSMGAPRQEEFLLALQEAGYKGHAIACGDFFDHYLEADDSTPHPAWMEKIRRHFLCRFGQEPMRLWRRYLIDYPGFFALVVMALTDKVWIKGKATKDLRSARRRSKRAPPEGALKEPP